jgi:hypothetical protein
MVSAGEPVLSRGFERNEEVIREAAHTELAASTRAGVVEALRTHPRQHERLHTPPLGALSRRGWALPPEPGAVRAPVTLATGDGGVGQQAVDSASSGR